MIIILNAKIGNYFIASQKNARKQKVGHSMEFCGGD